MKPLKEVFGNKVRVRVCGLCFDNNKILLVRHNIDGTVLWAPPGGGIDFGESIEATLIREFKEETALMVNPGKFLFIDEFIEPPLHAIELFYKIDSFTGIASPGFDPEVADRDIITQVGFFDKKQISQIPHHQLHSVLKICNNPIELLHIQGQLK